MKQRVFTINGAVTTAPFSSAGVNIYIAGWSLVFATDFGLTVNWDGDNKVDVSLCDAYSTFTCGLCGNSDGKIKSVFI